MESPYLNASESAQYLRITVKALYGLIERGKLKKLPGSRKIFFTKQQLDRYRTGDATDGPAPVRLRTDGRS